MPPPSSGGVAILQMLKVLEGYQLEQLPHNSATYLHLITETMKHAFADRAQYLGDPDFVHVPVRNLTSKEYARWIRSRISPDKLIPPISMALQLQSGNGWNHPFQRHRPFRQCRGVHHFGQHALWLQTLVPSGTGIVLNNEIDDFAIHSNGQCLRSGRQ